MSIPAWVWLVGLGGAYVATRPRAEEFGGADDAAQRFADAGGFGVRLESVGMSATAEEAFTPGATKTGPTAPTPKAGAAAVRPTVSASRTVAAKLAPAPRAPSKPSSPAKPVTRTAAQAAAAGAGGGGGGKPSGGGGKGGRTGVQER